MITLYDTTSDMERPFTSIDQLHSDLHDPEIPSIWRVDVPGHSVQICYGDPKGSATITHFHDAEIDKSIVPIAHATSEYLKLIDNVLTTKLDA